MVFVVSPAKLGIVSQKPPPATPTFDAQKPARLIAKTISDIIQTMSDIILKISDIRKTICLGVFPTVYPVPKKHIAGAMICGIWEIIIFANCGATHAFRPASPAVLSVKTKKHSLLFRV